MELHSAWRTKDRELAHMAAQAMSIVVSKGAPLRLVCRSAIQVRCLAGTAWITTEGDVNDVVLTLGQRHLAAQGDRLFINGMPDCRLRVDCPVATLGPGAAGGL